MDCRAGWHLTCDALVDEKSHRLRDENFVCLFLPRLIRFIDADLAPIKQEIIQQSEGIMAACMFGSGHITIYTIPSDCRFSLDLFMSKKFSESDVMAYIANSMNVLQRSSHYYQRVWPG